MQVKYMEPLAGEVREVGRVYRFCRDRRKALKLPRRVLKGFG